LLPQAHPLKVEDRSGSFNVRACDQQARSFSRPKNLVKPLIYPEIP
jgi:hypothetical protein